MAGVVVVALWLCAYPRMAVALGIVCCMIEEGPKPRDLGGCLAGLAASLSVNAIFGRERQL
jgi:hypothetical protein